MTHYNLSDNTLALLSKYHAPNPQQDLEDEISRLRVEIESSQGEPSEALKDRLVSAYERLNLCRTERQQLTSQIVHSFKADVGIPMSGVEHSPTKENHVCSVSKEDTVCEKSGSQKNYVYMYSDNHMTFSTEKWQWVTLEPSGVYTSKRKS